MYDLLHIRAPEIFKWICFSQDVSALMAIRAAVGLRGICKDSRLDIDIRVSSQYTACCLVPYAYSLLLLYSGFFF